MNSMREKSREKTDLSAGILVLTICDGKVTAEWP